MHTINVDEVKDALNQEIVIASSCSAKTKKAKDMKYNPRSGEFTIRYNCKGEEEEVNVLKHAFDAVACYNSFDA